MCGWLHIGSIFTIHDVVISVRIAITMIKDKHIAAPDELLNRITINRDVCFGKPCIKGTRIWFSLILDFLASGMSQEELLKEYPDLTTLDIQACLAYGAEMTRERCVSIPVSSRT